MRWSAKLLTIRGIDVRVHATFLFIVLLGAWRWGATGGLAGALFGGAFMLALFACVLLHELGHSFVAQRFGLKVKEIVLLPIGGVASLEGRAGAPRQEIAIALAGPAVNLVLAAGLVAAWWLSSPAAVTWAELSAQVSTPSWRSLLLLLASGNLSLALFNLLPIFPLDGGRVLRALLESRWGASRGTAWAATFGQVASILLLAYAVLSGQVLLALIAGLTFVAAGQENMQAQLRAPLASLTAGDVAELPALDLGAAWRVRDATPWLLRTQQSAFPVVQGEEVLGVVLRADLIAAAARPESALQSVQSLMRTAPRLQGSLPLENALAQLRQVGAPVAIVVGPDYPLGLLSEAEVLSKLLQAHRATWPPGARGPLVAPEQWRQPSSRG